MTREFLRILELLSFDEKLFRKEFIKTLGWVPKEDYPLIEIWMTDNQYTKKYHDLRIMLYKMVG